METTEVIIVGGGPAGLSCALILGRCKRKVLVFDTGTYRNNVSASMHGFLSRDGIEPAEFLSVSRNDLKKYEVSVYHEKIIKARKLPHGFSVWNEKGQEYQCKKLVLATGLNDQLPDIPGIEKFYGTSVFHCPYCDGWEFRDKPWIVHASTKKAALELCMRFKTWTNDVTLLTHHLDDFRRREISELNKCGIKIVRDKIRMLRGQGGRLESVEFANGESIPAAALFFSNGHLQQSDLARQLNCKTSRRGLIKFDKHQQTNVEGLHVAGDMARDMQFVIVAAAEGAKAAVAINTELNKENRTINFRL